MNWSMFWLLGYALLFLGCLEGDQENTTQETTRPATVEDTGAGTGNDEPTGAGTENSSDGPEGSSLLEDKRCGEQQGCELRYVGDETCAPCDARNPEFQCVNEARAAELELARQQTGVSCEECPPGDSPFEVFECRCEENNCTKVETVPQGNATSCGGPQGCELRYVGDETCAPCDARNPEFQCVNEARAAELELARQQTGVSCEECPPGDSPFEVFECRCEENNCTKVETVPQGNATSCGEEQCCELRYVGDETCAPCDVRNPEFQCVDEARAAELELARQQAGVSCEPCPFGDDPFEVYGCRYGETGCEKKLLEELEQEVIPSASEADLMKDEQGRYALRSCRCCCTEVFPSEPCTPGVLCEVPEEWWQCRSLEELLILAGVEKLPDCCSPLSGCSPEKFYRVCD